MIFAKVHKLMFFAGTIWLLVGCASTSLSRSELSNSVVYVVPLSVDGPDSPIDITYSDSTFSNQGWNEAVAIFLTEERGIQIGPDIPVQLQTKAGEIPGDVVQDFHDDVLETVNRILGVEARWWPESAYENGRPVFDAVEFDYMVRLLFTATPKVDLSQPLFADDDGGIELSVVPGNVFMWLFEGMRSIARNGIVGYDMRGDAEWWEEIARPADFDTVNQRAIDEIISFWQSGAGIPATEALFTNVEFIE